MQTCLFSWLLPQERRTTCWPIIVPCILWMASSADALKSKEGGIQWCKMSSKKRLRITCTELKQNIIIQARKTWHIHWIVNMEQLGIDCSVETIDDKWKKMSSLKLDGNRWHGVLSIYLITKAHAHFNLSALRTEGILYGAYQIMVPEKNVQSIPTEIFKHPNPLGKYKEKKKQAKVHFFASNSV